MRLSDSILDYIEQHPALDVVAHVAAGLLLTVALVIASGVTALFGRDVED